MMINFKSIKYCVIFFCLMIFFAGTQATEEDYTTIPCGVILPLTGNYSELGVELLQGIEIALQEINADGGIYGRKIDLLIVDNRGDPENSLRYFQEMRMQGVPVVIGSYHATLTLPMAEDTKKNQSPILICPRANAENLYGISPVFFQVEAPNFYLAKYVSEWISYTSDRLAIIYIDSDFGRSLNEGILSNLKNSSVIICGSEPVKEDSNSKDIAYQVIGFAPDTVVFAMYTPMEVSILENLSQLGYRGQVVLTDSENMNVLEKEKGEILANFSIFTISTETSLVPGNHVNNFVNEFQSLYGREPSRGGIEGYGYDTMMIIAEAMKTGCERNITAKSIQNGLKKIRYYGLTGPKIFDEYNAVRPAFDRWVFRNGKFELMGTSVE